MKKLITTLSALLFLFSIQTLSAQSADEIINTYLENIGGVEALSSVESMKSTGVAKTQGMALPIVMYQKAPGKQRMDFSFQGQTITQMAFDGETGWGMNMMTMAPEKWEQEQSNIVKSMMDFPEVFLNYADKGYQVSLEGEETIDGTECFKIKLTRNPITVDGEEEENFSYYFFDKESNVPIMQQEFVKYGPGKGMSSETFLSDYDEVEGVYYPHTITQKVNGQTAADITLEKIEVNIEIDETTFAFPEKKEGEGGNN